MTYNVFGGILNLAQSYSLASAEIKDWLSVAWPVMLMEVSLQSDLQEVSLVRGN